MKNTTVVFNLYGIRFESHPMTHETARRRWSASWRIATSRMPHVRNDECSRAKRVARRRRRATGLQEEESGVRAKIDEGQVPAAGNFGHFMGLRTPETI